MSAYQENAGSDLSFMLPGEALALRAGEPVLVGCHCKDCGTRTFPAYPVCPKCMSENVEREDMPKTGTVYAAATVHVGPAKWHKPFTVGYVDLDNGVRVFSHLKGNPQISDKVAIGLAQIGREANGTPINSFVFAKEEC